MPSIALNKIRVLDLSRVLAAPLATQMLGDLGADIIKVERPGAGDEARTYGPPFMNDQDGNPTKEAGFYLSANRNKRSITVNLASSDGQEVIRRLVAQSDVLIENYKTGTLRKYGLDYDSLKEINPRLVYCSVTGFGQTGPYAHRPGYDGIFQAMGGMMSVSGHPEEPMKVGISMVDILTSLYSNVAILSALHYRDQVSGKGQHIDMALLDCGLASLSHFAQNYLISGVVPQRRGNGGFGGIPSQVFQCADRPIFVVAGNNEQFRRFCNAAERPDIFADERFNSTAGRIANRDALLEILYPLFRAHNAEHWLDALEKAEVPASPVNELPDVLADPQIQHRQMITQTNHPAGGEIDILASPIRLSDTPVDGYSPPPVTGQHTCEILNEILGLTNAEIEALRRNNAI